MPTYGKPAAGVCLATALFVCGASGFPLAPGSLPPASGSLSLSASVTSSAHFAPGATLTLDGSGYAPRAAVSVAIYSSPITLAHVTADASGHLHTSVQLPTSLRGTHTLTAIGDGSAGAPRVLESVVDITAPSQAALLAHTGFDAATWGLGALAMIISGFALVRTAVFGRRFRPNPA